MILFVVIQLHFPLGGLDVLGFGLTEATLCCLLNIPDKPMKVGSVGVVMPNTEVQVIGGL